jgi:hypothetical protein
MRKTLLTLTALTALIGAGAASHPANATTAQPAFVANALVQPVQYYGDWRRERERAWEWRHREWERRRAWEHWHHFHDWQR